MKKEGKEEKERTEVPDATSTVQLTLPFPLTLPREAMLEVASSEGRTTTVQVSCSKKTQNQLHESLTPPRESMRKRTV